MSNQYISFNRITRFTPYSDIDIPQSGQLTKHENYDEIIIISDSASESPDEQIGFESKQKSYTDHDETM